MNHRTLFRITLLLLFSILSGVVNGQPIRKTLTTSDQELFQFTPPAGPARKVFVAKFVTEDPTPGATVTGDPTAPPSADNLNFQLETAAVPGSSSTYTDEPEFRLSTLNVPATDSVGETVVDLRAFDTTEPAAPGYRIIKIRIRFKEIKDITAGQTWAIKAKSLPVGTTVHFLGFMNSSDIALPLAPATVDAAEAAAETAATRPYLIEYTSDSFNFAAYTDFPAVKNLVFGTAHVSSSDAFAQSESYQFINVGTAPVSITAVNPATFPATGPYLASGYFTAPSTVLPLAPLTGTIFKFNPTTTGPAANVNVTLTINSPALPQLQVNLTGGYGIKLKTALLVDISGSMKDGVHGNSGVAEPDQKIFKARDAARYFLDVYKQNVPEAQIGLFTFPNLAGVCPNVEQVVNFEKANDATTFQLLHDQRLSRNHPSRIASDGGTPMAAGIQLVQSSLPAATDIRRLVFMVGDGQQYCLGDTTFPPGIQPSLAASGIKFYTVPYGDDQAAWTQQLKDIATWSGGKSFPVNLDAEDGKDGLKQRSENVLREVIGLETITDPTGTIQRNQRVRDKVCVPEDEYVLNFLVRWQSERVGAISIALETPEGTRIDKNTATTRPADVGYFETESFIGFCVRGSFLSGRNGVGDWWIELNGTTAIPPGQSVEFSYSVYSQSSLKSGYSINPWLVDAASRVELFVGDTFHRVRDASNITVQYRAPTASFGAWLATNKVDPQRVLAVTNAVAGEVASLAQRKLWVLRNQMKQTFDPKWETRTINLTRADAAPAAAAAAGARPVAAAKTNGALVYAAELSPVKVAGTYEFIGKIAGVTWRGDCFQRELSFPYRVGIRYTPDLIAKYLRIVPAETTPLYPAALAETVKKGPPAGSRFTAVSFTPRDDLGNYAGPGFGDQIKVSVSSGTLLPDAVDNLDGSFTYIVQHPSSQDPTISVGIEGVSSAPVALSAIGQTSQPPSGGGGQTKRFWIWILLLAVVVFIALLIKWLRSSKP